ncbi:MAG: M20 family metallopeptidase [Xanthobacteraceae bacterium]|nr:M20 family metallopeptidase [Xanthobacteraceae bacterium]
MDIKSRIESLTPDFVAWRRHLHTQPELAFEEKETAAFVAGRLREFGLEVHQGIAGTGVVGVLRRGNGPMVGLRSDIDALPITEATGVPYASKTPGRMHACGHDGHMAMLLGAARVLSEAPPQDGTIVFIFQPAEENEGGGKAMVEAGLFRDFPVSAVYGMHNWPGLPAGQFAVHVGPVMAAFDIFEAVVEGQGSHGAMPHQGIDPIAVAAQLHMAWQLIVSRTVNPTDAAVISVTQIHAGDTWNVVPDAVTLRGTVRTLRPQTRDMIEARMAERAEHICRAFGARARFRYERRYPATINTAAEAETARLTAAEAGAQGPVLTDLAPSMASEDFAYMLQEKPGAYVWVGNGPAEDGRNLHSPRYDFNDAVLPIGVEYWVKLAHRALGA